MDFKIPFLPQHRKNFFLLLFERDFLGSISFTTGDRFNSADDAANEHRNEDNNEEKKKRVNFGDFLFVHAIKCQKAEYRQRGEKEEENEKEHGSVCRKDSYVMEQIGAEAGWKQVRKHHCKD